MKPHRWSFRVKEENLADLKCSGKISSANNFGFKMTNDLPLGVQVTICDKFRSDNTFMSYANTKMEERRQQAKSQKWD